jgi:hypothetical protein
LFVPTSENPPPCIVAVSVEICATIAVATMVHARNPVTALDEPNSYRLECVTMVTHTRAADDKGTLANYLHCQFSAANVEVLQQWHCCRTLLMFIWCF